MKQTFANAFECYEYIGRRLVEAVPQRWNKITIDFEIIAIDDVCDYCIVYEPKGWFRKEAQFFIEDTFFTDSFFQLARLTSTPEKGLFKKCVFVIQDGGKYTSQFEY